MHTVRSGKFRRYHGDSLAKRVLDMPTNLKNARDAFYVVAGYGQSRRLLKKLRPDVVFIKGSSVGVPIGKACQSLKIPYFTHDSDSVPSLTNRILSEGAVLHAVGMPPESFARRDADMRYTGIPVSPEYKLVDSGLEKQYRRQLGLPGEALVLTVTGGSLGAQRLNSSFRAVAEPLLQKFPKLHILHQTGSAETLYEDLPAELKARVQEVAYTDHLVAYTGAADLVVARAGATTIAELAIQGKACLLVPNPQLTGGQQSRNADFLKRKQAAVIVDEGVAGDPQPFLTVLVGLLESKTERQKVAAGIRQLAKPDAARELAAIIEELASK